MKEVVVVGGVRTPGGKFGGTLQDVPVPELGALVVKEVVSRTGTDPVPSFRCRVWILGGPSVYGRHSACIPIGDRR